MVIWIDKNRKEYELMDISDSYLINILNHVYNGGGWDSFVDIKTMERLYDESVKRKLKINIGKYEYMKVVEERIEVNRQLRIEREMNDFDWMNFMF